MVHNNSALSNSVRFRERACRLIYWGEQYKPPKASIVHDLFRSSLYKDNNGCCKSFFVLFCYSVSCGSLKNVLFLTQEQWAVKIWVFFYLMVFFHVHCDIYKHKKTSYHLARKE